jgi:lysophospholipase L1-like esterase
MNKRFAASLLLIFATLAAAQQPADSSLKAEQQLQAWRNSRSAALMDDFGELARYRKANAELKATAAGENRVVFYGDSITDFWDLAKSFPQKPYINRGISGQTTAQMLLRFRQDVVDLHPKAVVILAGTNDISGNTGPMSLEQIESNYASMADIARVNDIRVIFSSVTPVNNYTKKSAVFYSLRPMKLIDALNTWLRAYCAAHGDVYLDYYSAMIDSSGMLKREYSEDGLHPNERGYSVMAPLAEAAIRTALGGETAVKAKPGN